MLSTSPMQGAEIPSPLIGQFVVPIPRDTLNYTRNIALTLLRTFAERSSYVLGVTSALPSEGKTTISVGLAEVMASDFGLNVILVDGHAERSWPRPSDEADDRQRGFSDWLTGDAHLSDVLVPVHEKCTVLGFGTQDISTRDVLQYSARLEVTKELRERYSMVILDLPDLMNPAAAALANQCDGLVIVVRAGDTRVDSITEFLPLLQNVTLHGVVLNRHQSAVPESISRRLLEER